MFAVKIYFDFLGESEVLHNFKVDDVDAEYARLVEAGLAAVMPLEDHPWGDRGFSIIDPVGNAIYINSDREPSDEFKQYYYNGYPDSCSEC